MPDERQTISHPDILDSDTTASSPAEPQDEWAEDLEEQELPRRPRRRLLTPIPLALVGVLLIAAGFIAGVQVQKQESSSGSAAGTTAGLASRFAALRSTGANSSKADTGTGAAAGLPGAGDLPNAGGAATRPTSGTVAYLAGSTLYVTNSEGNTVKVKTASGTSVTKTVKTKVARIYPGETVTVTGATGSDGVVKADSISVGSSSSGLAALLGSSGSGSSTGSPSAAGGAALFGAG